MKEQIFSDSLRVAREAREDYRLMCAAVRSVRPLPHLASTLSQHQPLSNLNMVMEYFRSITGTRPMATNDLALVDAPHHSHKFKGTFLIVSDFHLRDQCSKARLKVRLQRLLLFMHSTRHMIILLVLPLGYLVSPSVTLSAVT